MKIAVCLNTIQPRDGTSHFKLTLEEMVIMGGMILPWWLVIEQVEAYPLPQSLSGLSNPSFRTINYLPGMIIFW